MRATRALRSGTETARLQRDTQQQQEALNELRAQMRQEKERRDAAPRGGTRWGSAAVKKVALGRSYGKDVRKRLEQRTPSGHGRAAASRRDGRF